MLPFGGMLKCLHVHWLALHMKLLKGHNSEERIKTLGVKSTGKLKLYFSEGKHFFKMAIMEKKISCYVALLHSLFHVKIINI